MKWIAVAVVALLGCQRGDSDKPAPSRPPRGGIRLCQGHRRPVLVDDPLGRRQDRAAARQLTIANWLAANLTTPESRKFLVAIQPLTGTDKADAGGRRPSGSGCPGAPWPPSGGSPP